MDLLSPTMDFIFKRIFGSDENQDVLVKFFEHIPHAFPFLG